MEQLITFQNNNNSYQYLVENLSHYQLIKDIVDYFPNKQSEESIDITVPNEIKLNEHIIKFLNTKCLDKLKQSDCYHLYIFIDFLCNQHLKQKIINHYMNWNYCIYERYKNCNNDPNETLYLLKLINRIFGYIPNVIMHDIVNNVKLIVYLMGNMDDPDILKSIIFLLNLSTEDSIKILCKNHCIYNETNREKVYHDRFIKLLDGIILPPSDLNYIVAGGSINLILDQTLDLDQYPLSDIDIFLYGSEQVLTLERILNWIISTYGQKNIYLHRIMSVHSIWINDKRRSIQLILTNYEDPYDIVKSFDFTHLKCWYQNNNFYQTLDCYYSILTKKSSTITLSPNPLRIHKTISRGYIIHYPMSHIKDSKCAILDIHDDIAVQKYQLMKTTYHELLPKSNNTIITNIINIATVSGYDYKKIYTGDKINVVKLLYSNQFNQFNHINDYQQQKPKRMRGVPWSLCTMDSNKIKLVAHTKIPYIVYMCQTLSWNRTIPCYIHLGKLSISDISFGTIYLSIGQNKTLIYQTYLNMLQKIRANNTALFSQLPNDFFNRHLDNILFKRTSTGSSTGSSTESSTGSSTESSTGSSTGSSSRSWFVPMRTNSESKAGSADGNVNWISNDSMYEIGNYMRCSGRKLGKDIKIGDVLNVQIAPKFYGFKNKIFDMVTVLIDKKK
jgi:hypothetical protein